MRPWVEDHMAMDDALARRWLGEDLDLSIPLPSDRILAAAQIDPNIGAWGRRIPGHDERAGSDARTRTAGPHRLPKRLASTVGRGTDPRRDHRHHPSGRRLNRTNEGAP